MLVVFHQSKCFPNLTLNHRFTEIDPTVASSADACSLIVPYVLIQELLSFFSNSFWFLQTVHRPVHSFTPSVTASIDTEEQYCIRTRESVDTLYTHHRRVGNEIMTIHFASDLVQAFVFRSLLSLDSLFCLHHVHIPEYLAIPSHLRVGSWYFQGCLTTI